jgi:hypothetical protein
MSHRLSVRPAISYPNHRLPCGIECSMRSTPHTLHRSQSLLWACLFKARNSPVSWRLAEAKLNEKAGELNERSCQIFSFRSTLRPPAGRLRSSVSVASLWRLVSDGSCQLLPSQSNPVPTSPDSVGQSGRSASASQRSAGSGGTACLCFGASRLPVSMSWDYYTLSLRGSRVDEADLCCRDISAC